MPKKISLLFFVAVRSFPLSQLGFPHPATPTAVRFTRQPRRVVFCLAVIFLPHAFGQIIGHATCSCRQKKSAQRASDPSDGNEDKRECKRTEYIDASTESKPASMAWYRHPQEVEDSRPSNIPVDAPSQQQQWIQASQL